MINNPVIFYLASALIILFTFFALFARNVIYSLLWAVLVFFSGALFFYILGSEYNAIIQAAIYGLAIPVILGLSIMFGCGLKQSRTKIRRGYFSYILFICAGIFIMAFIYLIMISLVINPGTFHIAEIQQTTTYDTLRAFARGIFINYVWAFELVSLLLTIVIAGLSLWRKRGV